MRIRNSDGAAVRSGALRRTGLGTTERITRSRPPGPRIDAATIVGLPEAELAPKVRAAIGRLMAEVRGLREELTRARKRIDHLERLADQDTLAPVMNRRAFVRELTRMTAFAGRYGVPGSVLYFDINGMKQINDSQGHATGDAVLKHVAQVLLRDVRASDVVGRLGGDEFGVILAQAGPEAAVAKASSLADAIRSDPVHGAGQPLKIAVSYGIHTFAGGEEADAALDAADRAMYAQKCRADAGTSQAQPARLPRGSC
ncbi:MAG: GGDEF domain-containing protein [Kiloniellaceae bacterium]